MSIKVVICGNLDKKTGSTELEVVDEKSLEGHPEYNSDSLKRFLQKIKRSAYQRHLFLDEGGHIYECHLKNPAIDYEVKRWRKII